MSGVRIDAENFGPVRRASIAPKDLTVFIGPNNAGKSAMAMLLYACFRASPNTQLPGDGGRPRYLARPEVAAMNEDERAEFGRFIVDLGRRPTLPGAQFPPSV